MTKPKDEVIDVEAVAIEDAIDEHGNIIGADIVHQPIGQVSIYRSMDPAEQLAEAQARAAVLVQVITAQGLSKRFGGPNSKPHVFVEGWMFLASQFGLIPEIEWTRELDNGWEARAVLRRLSDGLAISHAEMECRTDEANWTGRASYAVRSMAQTRAVSKVCRISLSSVMVMAGMSATPAEEMQDYSYADGYGDSGASDVSVTLDDPHCPACLDKLGTLVGVWENPKKPFQKCKAKEKCADWDGKFPWSGWRSSWENSVAEYRGGVVKDDPQTAVITDTDRTQRSGYIVHEIMGIAGIVDRADAEALVKPGLILAIDLKNVDTTAALGGAISTNPTDDELRAVIANLTLIEADAVIAAAASLKPPERKKNG